MWKKAFGENEVKSFFQLLGYASSPGKSNLPVIVFPDYFEELSTPAGKAPIIWYLSKEHQLLENPTTVEIFRKRIQAVPKKMPQAVLDKLQFKTVIAVPLEAALPLLVSGGVNHTFAELHTSKQVKHFIEVAQGYYAAEGRPTSLQSSIEVLDQLSQLDLIHNKIRHIIILFSGGMLALIIGSISWLELRQEIYLISLLRSFGVGKTIIIFHQFFENLMIIGTGVLISLYSWNKVYSSLTKSLPTLTSSDSVTILPADIQTLALFSLIGAILSSLPVVIGIRKQIGLILQ